MRVQGVSGDWSRIEQSGPESCYAAIDRRALFETFFTVNGRIWRNDSTSFSAFDPSFEGPPEPIEVLCPVGALSGERKDAVLRYRGAVETWSQE